MYHLSVKKGLVKKDVFYEKLKKWGSGDVLGFKKNVSTDAIQIENQ